MSDLIATLPMYDWPEMRAEVDAQWARIRDRLRAAGIDAPEALTREDDLHAMWVRTNLLLGQTCWGPMDSGLAKHVQVVSQPSYDGIEGAARAAKAVALHHARTGKRRCRSTCSGESASPTTIRIPCLG
jgi:hypothetical protein